MTRSGLSAAIWVQADATHSSSAFSSADLHQQQQQQ
jgi:hypothetical protein